jgi:hypothetical protein
MTENVKSRAKPVKLPDYRAAIKYVVGIAADPITLTSIHPDGGQIFTRTFKKSDATTAMAWLKEQQLKGRGIYYQDCSVASINKRPKKPDVNVLHCAHADMDVQGAHFTTPDFAAAKAAVLDKLKAYDPPPSIIIDTGNGYQGFWYLTKSLPATAENIAKVEAVSKRIAADLGGDSCHDVAHLMRLPHTLNFPKKLKRDLGRVKCLSAIESDDRWINVYSLASLPSDPVEEAAESEDVAVDIPDDVDLSGLDPDFRKLIVEGPGERKYGGGSRSDYCYFVQAELIRQGFTDGQVAWITTNPDFAVSAHILDQKQRPNIEQTLRGIRDLRSKGESPIPEAKVEFTESAEDAAETIKTATDKAQRERKEWERDAAIVVNPPMFIDLPRRKLMSDRSFAKKYAHHFGKSKSPAADAAKSKLIARYDRAGYRPTPLGTTLDSFVKDGETYYNLYRAPGIVPIFDVKPEIYLAHLRYLIPDRATRIQFADWLAHLVQHPDQKMMFAALLMGKPGTGKSWLADAMKVIMGAWNVSTPRNKTLTRDFNGWISEKTLGILHELKGKFETVDVFKDLITQPTVEVNKKGIEPFEIESFINFLTITNHDDALPLDDDDRRWFGIECATIPNLADPTPSGDKHFTHTKESKAYYKRLFETQPADSPATEETRRFLGWLLKRKIVLDVKGMAPPTKARTKVIESGRSSLESLIVQMRADKDWPFNCPLFSTTDLFKAIDMSQVEPKDRNIKAVEKAVKKIGCQPLAADDGDGGARRIRTSVGLKRVWVYVTDAAAMKKLPSDKLVAIYETAHKAKTKSDDADTAADFKGEDA